MRLFDTYPGKPGSLLETLNYIYDTTTQRHEVTAWFDDGDGIDGSDDHAEGSAADVLHFIQLYREHLNSSDVDRLTRRIQRMAKSYICPPMSNSIAALASKANAAASRYRELVDSKANYYVLRSAGNELRAATDALVSAIADEMS